MKIVEVSKHEYHYVTTEDGTEYRRNSATDWEELMGQSWECPHLLEERMEPFFQDYIKAHPENKGNNVIIIVDGGLISGIFTDSKELLNVKVHDFDLFDGATDDELRHNFGKVIGKEEYWDQLNKQLIKLNQIY